MNRMDIDLNQFDEDIARYDDVHAKEGNTGVAMGAAEVSLNIAKAVASVLPKISKATPRGELDKIEYLCEKAVEYSMYPNRRILQGQFYYQIEDYPRAAAIFDDVFTISQQTDRFKQWPHLDKNESNITLVTMMARNFHRLGDDVTANKFADVVRKWQGQTPSAPEPQ